MPLRIKYIFKSTLYAIKYSCGIKPQGFNELATRDKCRLLSLFACLPKPQKLSAGNFFKEIIFIFEKAYSQCVKRQIVMVIFVYLI